MSPDVEPTEPDDDAPKKEEPPQPPTPPVVPKRRWHVDDPDSRRKLRIENPREDGWE